MTISPEYGQLPQAPELKLCIARTGGPIPAGGATERNLCPDRSWGPLEQGESPGDTRRGELRDGETATGSPAFLILIQTALCSLRELS